MYLVLDMTNRLLYVQKDQAISTIIHSKGHAMFMPLSLIHVYETTSLVQNIG